MRETHKRSIAKAVSWRIVGTASLALVVYFFTDKPFLSLGISVIDIISNLILYYFHERIWDRIDWGRSFLESFFHATKKRILAKTLTWRLIATLYLLIVIFALTKKLLFSANVVLIDASLNIIEYYGHEWIWDQIKWGREFNIVDKLT